MKLYLYTAVALILGVLLGLGITKLTSDPKKETDASADAAAMEARASQRAARASSAAAELYKKRHPDPLLPRDIKTAVIESIPANPLDPMSPERRVELAHKIYYASASDMAGLHDDVKRLKDPYLNKVLFARWAEVDLETALKVGAKEYDSFDWYAGKYPWVWDGIFSTWIQKHPEGLIKKAMSPESSKSMNRMQALETIGEAYPDRALEMMAKISSEIPKGDPFFLLAGASSSKPFIALEWYQKATKEQQQKFIDFLAKGEDRTTIARYMLDSDPEKAMRWVEGLNNERLSKRFREELDAIKGQLAD
ncbi:hypothetical protein NT6N_36870 [Oceaniferula spumae]|uniref:HEAT repeat domain-containing protein n=1 Tax=Oceaniferula spumae TaxID=2979115 RepID=A0AAT9FR65_9BACT